MATKAVSKANWLKDQVHTFEHTVYQRLKDDVSDPIEGSFQWVLSNSAYTEWLTSPKDAVIQISGAVGSGKSVLAKKILDRELDGIDCVKAHFFAPRSSNGERATATTAFRAIALQVLSARPDLVNVISSKLESHPGKTASHLQCFADVLIGIIECWHSGLLVCVLDGLEECEEQGKDNWMDLLRMVSESAHPLSESQRGAVKVLFTSRSHVVTEYRLKRTIPTIKLSGLSESAAIQSEIESIIHDSLRDVGHNFIVGDMAIGILAHHVLWIPHLTYSSVVLTLQRIHSAIAGSGKETLANLIISLPRMIPDPYELLLQYFHNSPDARMLTEAVLVARRPLSLSDIKVILALDRKFASDSPGAPDRDQSPLSSDYIKRLCSPIIALHEDKLFFIYEDAREFLAQHSWSDESSEKSLGQKSRLRHIHRHLAIICMEYLQGDSLKSRHLSVTLRENASFQNTPAWIPWVRQNYMMGRMSDLLENHAECHYLSSNAQNCTLPQILPSKMDSFEDHTDILQEVRTQCLRHPFLEYSATYWHEHLKESEALSDDEIWRTVSQLYEMPTFTTWFSIYWTMKPVVDLPHFTALTISMALDHASIIPLLIARGAQIEARDSFNQRALHWAALIGTYEMLELLLQHGACVDPADSAMRTPLHLALLTRTDALRKVSLLIQKQANVNAADFQGLTPLHLVGNDRTLAELLTVHGSRIDQGDKIGRTPLMMAAANDAVDVARLLLERGAKPTDRTIQRAQCEGSMDVVHLLTEWNSPESIEQVQDTFLPESLQQISLPRFSRSIYNNKTISFDLIDQPTRGEIVENIALSTSITDLAHMRVGNLWKTMTDNNEKSQQAWQTKRRGYPVSVISKKLIRTDAADVNTEQGQIIPESKKLPTEYYTTSTSLYQSLPEGTIRVVDLLPGSGEDPICVNLRPISIKNPEAYEALSYTWGSTTDCRQISVDGSPFEITTSLFSALSYFRRESSVRTLWVDAIAINQKSDAERTQQVRLMTIIYDKASQVLSWLGESRCPMTLEALFNVAHERHDYAAAKIWLEAPEGEHPLLLASTDEDCMRVVAAVQHAYRCRQKSHPSGENDTAVVFKGNADSDWSFLLVGSKKAPDTYQISEAMMTITPDFVQDQILLAALKNFPTFEEFLIDAAKPALLELSTEKMLQIVDGLNDLTNRPYWTRAWIVQEVIASRECLLYFSNLKDGIDIEVLGAVFGLDKRKNMDTKNFIHEDLFLLDAVKSTAICKRLNDHGSKEMPALHHLWTFSKLTYDRMLCRSSLPTWRFGRLLENYSGQKAKDARDKIFSLMGLLQIYSSSGMETEWWLRTIDYKFDLRTVYINAARYLIQIHQQRTKIDDRMTSEHILDDFYVTRDSQADTDCLPSWVPDLTADDAKEAVIFNEGRVREIDVLMKYDAHVSGDLLTLSGHRVDEVVWVSEIFGRTDLSLYREIEIWLWIQEHDLGTVYGNDDARFDAFWRTIIADNITGVKVMPDFTFEFRGQPEVDTWIGYCKEKFGQLQAYWGDKLKEQCRRKVKLNAAINAIQERMKTKSGDTSTKQFAVRFVDPTDESLDPSARSIASSGLKAQTGEEPVFEPPVGRMELSQRHLVISREGYFCLSSPGVEVGDSITLLAGSAFPWFLHKVEKDQYKIHARGWVCGLMYMQDEYFNDWNSKVVEQITLR